MKRTTKKRAAKSTAEKAIDKGPTIIDQMVTNTVSLNAFPQHPERRSFTLELDIYPDFGTVHISKRPYLKPDAVGHERVGVELEIYELATFAEGLMELVTIARERGFLR
ncbi:MAG: hypothetical protein H0T48_12545 [Gemmatimonadaceae bacterium]|nr:hypothetical protein [Gemmatimonadaceae bacterium]